MRYELSDYEWTAIKPMLPNKPRGVRRVNDRRVLNGIFWVLRTPCFHKRCYSRIVDTTRTGSGSLPASKARGPTFRRNEIAKTRSVSARICIVRGT